MIGAGAGADMHGQKSISIGDEGFLDEGFFRLGLTIYITECLMSRSPANTLVKRVP